MRSGPLLPNPSSPLVAIIVPRGIGQDHDLADVIDSGCDADSPSSGKQRGILAVLLFGAGA